MIHTIADKGSFIDNTPFLIFVALIGAAVAARWLANHLYDRRRAVEEAMRRHPAGKAVEVDDLQAEWERVPRRCRGEAAPAVTRLLTAKIHAIAEDGLPDMDALTGQVAFIFDGCIVSGWPLLRGDPEVADVYARHGYDGTDTLWEANSDVGHNRPFGSVTHWVEFPVRLWEIR